MRPPARGVISVAELNRRLRRSVELVSAADWVQGEVRGLRKAASGHAYFSLRDEREDAVVDCVMYRSQYIRAGRVLVEGAALQVVGRATVWAPRGRLQFIAEGVRPVGRGALLEALDRLKAQLSAEGLFDPERKRALPQNPQIVGVVTSAHGAAWHDIRAVALRRSSLRLVIAPALVQGDGAAQSIVRALDLLERYPGLEAIIIGRGGGSLEDLMPFNDERVVRRVAACQCPTVSAVGHEIDLSLCDWAADVRAATPSEAAEKLVPDANARVRELNAAKRNLVRSAKERLREDRALLASLKGRLGDPRYLIADKQQGLDELTFRMERRLKKQIAAATQQQRVLERRLSSRHPRVVITRSRAQLAPLSLRLQHALRGLLSHSRQRVNQLDGRLLDLSPLAVLSRGYAIALDASGRAVKDSATLSVGESLEVLVHRGRIGAEVIRIQSGSKEEPET